MSRATPGNNENPPRSHTKGHEGFFFFFVPLRVTSWRIFEGAFKEIINPAGCWLTLHAAEMPGRPEPD
jgi:hypothetical protein